MNNKLIFRILGALACAMIIVSVFVPYMNNAGNTVNLWDSYKILNSLYLPIMILVFGLIGVIFFALNIKTEFAYMTTGAISFFLVMQTILYIDVFTSLSLGYYLQGVGAILTGVMAFLCNLKTKVKVVEQQPIEQTNETSMLDQIDKLYNDQQPIQQIETIQPVIQPISVEPIQNIQIEQPIQQPTPVVEETQTQPIQQPSPVVEETQTQPVQQPTPVVQEPQPQQPSPESVSVVQETQMQSVVEQQPVNPVLQEFNFEPINVQSLPVEPEMIQSQQQVNPVMQEFNFNNSNVQPEQQIQNVDNILQPTVESQLLDSSPVETINTTNTTNPVIQDFMNQSVSTSNNNQNNNSLDIFG